MKNKLVLSLSNFQSISEGELVFEEGLNFIIGQSNSGKSATFRALKACLLNPSGSQRFIKNGTKRASVQLTYNGNEIMWLRTPKESSYYINGEEYVKTGRSSAFKILPDETGFVDDNDSLVNIEEELQLPFPFGMSKSELFKLYENIFCVSDSATILKSAKEHEDRVKFDISNIESDIRKNTTKIEELHKFSKEVDLEKLKKMLSWLRGSKNRLDMLKEGIDIIRRAVKADSVNIQFEVKEFTDLTISHAELVRLNKMFTQLKRLNKVQKELPKNNVDRNVLSDYEELKALKKELDRVISLDNMVLSSQTFEEYKTRYEELRALLREIKKVHDLSNIEFKKLEIQDVMTRYTDLISYYNSITRIKNKIAELEKSRIPSAEKIREIEEKLKEYKVCPLCGQEIKGEKNVRK